MLPDAILHAEAPHQGARRLPSPALELGDRPPQHLVGTVAEQLLRPRAPVRDAAPHVGRDDSRGRVLRDGAEEVPGAPRLLVQPGVADRPRGLGHEALEKLPVLGIEVERRPPVQREDAEQRVLVDDRHDVRAPEVVLPEPVHREDAPVREHVRDDQGLAVRRDPAGQPFLELDATPRIRGGEPLVGERPRLERPRRLVGHPEPDGRRLHQLRGRARDLAEDLVEVERRRDDARQPRECLEAGEPPVGDRLLVAQPRDLDVRRFATHGRILAARVWIRRPVATRVLTGLPFLGARSRATHRSPAQPSAPAASEDSRRASEVPAPACVGAVARARACPAAVGAPGVHQAAASRVRAATRRHLRRRGHPPGELRDWRSWRGWRGHERPPARRVPRDGGPVTGPCRWQAARHVKSSSPGLSMSRRNCAHN